MTTLYGIKNCDTVRKARQWLDQQGIDYHFHDLRSDGLDETVIRHWSKAINWEALLNRRSTTWRQLAETDKKTLNENKAIQLMLAHPALIKRPVLDVDGKLYIGFKSVEYKILFGQN
jgi:Spx/MgsR family transcriptional regulator